MKQHEVEDYYSPQSMATRMLTLDLALHNLQVFVQTLHERLDAMQSDIDRLKKQCKERE